MRRTTSRLAALLAVLLAGLVLAACANADGSLPRLAGGAPAPSSGFNGGYAGTSGSFGDLATRSAPF